ncbi:uncharacterized protein C1orf87 homolog [Hyaena hyaena]|uniref:uncharacterized protein C1orf87 homolog n=1 Tax=Hyaena hyaena TaxID=95912 RepID=UPI0019239CD0|nr:uncharacterized protein C1orf87 homolog [Hyaena hyaena]
MEDFAMADGSPLTRDWDLSELGFVWRQCEGWAGTPVSCRDPGQSTDRVSLSCLGGETSPQGKENENLKAETPTGLHKCMIASARRMSRDSPAPTNPSAHQINHDPDEEEESKHPGNHQSPENSQKFLTGALRSRFLDGRIPSQTNAHCSSVPTGDQSLSYIHGLPRRKLRAWSLEQMARGSSDQPEDFGQRPSGTTREDAFLLALVRRELHARPLSSSLLEKLQKELKTLDPISSGFLLQSQLSRLFLRHEVPLQLPTVKVLCQRFSKRDSPEMVSYGKLLWFLKAAASDDPQQTQRDVGSNEGKSQGYHDHGQSTAPQGASSQSEVSKSLSEILMALRTTNGKLNIENLSRNFRREDRLFSGSLPLPKVRAICGKHGLYLTLSFLETLLNHQDLGYYGEIKWQNFVELLSKASSDLPHDLPTGKKAKETSATTTQAEVPKVSQGQTEHMKIPEEELQPENPPAEISAPKGPLKALQFRPISQPFMTPMVKNRNESEEYETWIDRFRKLENALYLCDLSNTGVLEKERARRLIHNYNLIYNLSLSPRKIDQALRRFCAGENMLLEPALRYLKEL